MPFMFRMRLAARRLTTALLLCSPPALCGGCAYDDAAAVTGPIKASAASTATDADLRAKADQLSARYDAAPGDKAVSIDFAGLLRKLKRYDQAVAVMQSAAVKAPKDLDVLGAYGKALADDGQLEQAAAVLANSYTPDSPNWSDMSAQAYVADRLGDHAEAQRLYQSALKIAPGDPTVLNNLGLSYALSKQLKKAEETLREASAQGAGDERIRANLALVLSLEGKFGEAERISQQDMPPTAAAANVAAIRAMLAQPNSWRQIETTEIKRGKDQKANAAFGRSSPNSSG